MESETNSFHLSPDVCKYLCSKVWPLRHFQFSPILKIMCELTWILRQFLDPNWHSKRHQNRSLEHWSRISIIFLRFCTNWLGFDFGFSRSIHFPNSNYLSEVHAIWSYNEHWDFPTTAGSSLFLPKFSLLLTFLRFLGPYIFRNFH